MYFHYGDLVLGPAGFVSFFHHLFDGRITHYGFFHPQTFYPFQVVFLHFGDIVFPGAVLFNGSFSFRQFFLE